MPKHMRPTWATMREHTRLEDFTLYAELSQIIDENVQLEKIKSVVGRFAYDCVHRCTKEMFEFKTINAFHYKESDYDLSMSIYTSIMGRRYDSLDALEEYLTALNVTLITAMQNDVKTGKYKAYTIWAWVTSLFAVGVTESGVAGGIVVSLLAAAIYASIFKMNNIKNKSLIWGFLKKEIKDEIK